MMKALIIDDEKLARMEIRLLLTEHKDIEVVGEASNADEGLELIQKMEPELIFLDIMMPGGTGFSLLESLEQAPHVIFTTASKEFALKAFEVNAMDYLIKPLNEQRLAEALNKIRMMLKESDDKEDHSTELKGNANYNQIFIKDGDNCWFIKLDKLRLVESEGNYARLFFNEEKPLINRTLNQIEKRLPENCFFRANRKQIINLDWVESVNPWFTGGLKVRLQDETEVQMSRRSAQLFKAKLGI